MSKVLVTPAVTRPKVTMTEAHKRGYNFGLDRWEGEEHYPNAHAVCLHFCQRGWASNIYTDKITRWEGGKSRDFPVFRVWLGHPTEDLYAWWAPTDSEWLDPIKIHELTWYEFQRKEKKEKK